MQRTVTAAGIDVSERLKDALLPFGLVLVPGCPKNGPDGSSSRGGLLARGGGAWVVVMGLRGSSGSGGAERDGHVVATEPERVAQRDDIARRKVTCRGHYVQRDLRVLVLKVDVSIGLGFLIKLIKN